MALIDRPIVRAGLSLAEERLNVSLIPADRRRELEVREQEYVNFAAEAEDLAFHSLDYFGHRPQELRPWARKRIAQRSRVALLWDPLAGAEAQLLGDFAIGQGLSIPTATHPKVQDAIDSAWCHDDATEALTDEGWMGYRELRARWESGRPPQLAQFDCDNGRISFARPSAMAATSYDGEMVRSASRRGPSFMVTPDHRMVTRETALGGGGWSIRRAHGMRSQEYVPVAAPAEGVRVEEFVLPGCVKREPSAKRAARGDTLTPTALKTRHIPVTIPMDAWLEWLGWYIAEGSHAKPSVVQQIDSSRLGALTRACAALGVPGRSWVRDGRLWEWAPCPNKQFREWLHEHVGSTDVTKRLPAFVFSLATEQREKLLDGLMGGDGTPTDWRQRGKGAYYTSSPHLADDVQRLATLCGWRATLTVLPIRRNAAQPERVVYLSRRAEKLVKAPERVPYRGDVWCFRMPRGTMVTRRDGTVLISGNSDANNQEKLTSYVALRKRSNELLTSGELFITLRTGGGGVRVGRLDADRVIDIVTDPEDSDRPLWYVTEERRQEWDFNEDRPKPAVEQMVNGRPKIVYWKHWRNYDDAVREREMSDTSGETPLETPPADKIAPGVVYHLPINQTGDQLRGNPPWARALRFFTAMNVLTEAHVTMAQAASTFIARRVVRGTPNQVRRAANQVLEMAGELGASRWGAGTSAHRFEGTGGLTGSQGGEWLASGEQPPTRPFTPIGQPGPMPPGSWWNENESSRLEALNLNSGAAQMAQSAQIVRAPIAAQAGFGQHYLGDTSDANLATASTLELPATMHVTSWQELLEQLLRWFTDRAIEEALKAGKLGPVDNIDLSTPGVKPLSDLRLHEAEDRAQLEQRVGKPLSYDFTMPFPGRRQLPDVTTFVGTIAQAMDPNGVNIPLRRQLLRFAYEQIGIDDVARAVQEAIPDKPFAGGIGPQDQGGGGSAFGQPAQPGGGRPMPGQAPPDAAPAAGQQPYGARSNASQPPATGLTERAGEDDWLHDPRRRMAVDELSREVAALFRDKVERPTLAALGAGENGSA